MKVSMHSGREGSAKHNDRSFLRGKTKQEMQEMAPHIDLSKTDENLLYIRKGDGKYSLTRGTGTDLEAAERRFYEERYGDAQEAKNARYRAQGHPERQKSTDDLYKGKKTRPEEIIIQVGSKEEPVEKDVFWNCFREYVNELELWNFEHGEHMKILSFAVHDDETVTHVHLRRVWEYDSPDGPRLGQEKALEAAGVSLPYPDKPKGRYNNRKITFDRMMRDKWIDICIKRGLDIDRAPVPGMRHKNKADYIRDRIADDIAKARQERDAAIAERDAAIAQRDAARHDLDTKFLRAEVDRMQHFMSKVEYSDGHTVLDEYERRYKSKTGLTNDHDHGADR